MSRIKPLGLRLENIEGAAAVENYDAEESLAVEAEAAAAVGEADMVAEETGEMTASIDESTEAATELATEVIPQLEEAAAEDGLAPREAEALNQRLERICARAGIDYVSTGLVMRRESFGSTASRKAQTGMRLEAAEGVFAKIVENVKKAWAWLLDQVGTIWNKFTSNADGIKKRLNDIQTRCTQVSASAKPVKSRLKTGARFFSIDRKTDVSTIEKVVGSVEALNGSLKGMQDALGNMKLDQLSTGKSTAEMTKAFNDSFLTSVNGLEKREASKLVRNLADKEKELLGVHGYLPSGRAFVAEKSKVVSGNAAADIAKVTLEVVEDSFADDYDAFKSGNDINAKLIQPGLKLVNVLVTAQKSKAETETAIKRVMDICDSLAKETTAFSDNAKNADKDDLRNAITVRLEILKAAQGLTKQLINQSPKMIFDTAATLSDMAADNVSNLKEDKK